MADQVPVFGNPGHFSTNNDPTYNVDQSQNGDNSYYGPGNVGDVGTPASMPNPGGNQQSPGFWNSILSMLGSNGNSGDLTNMQGPLTLAALAAAGQQYSQAGRYTDLGKQAAQMADPFAGERAGYMTKLRNLETDPNAYLESSPDYMAARGQGIAGVDSSAASKGFAGAGRAAQEVADYSSKLGAQYLDRDRQSLMQMAGANFNPGQAGSLMMQGGQLGMQSENAALGNMFLPLMYAAGAQQRGNSPGTGGGGQGTNPAIQQAIQAGKLLGGGSPGTPPGIPPGYAYDPQTGDVYDPDGNLTGTNAFGPGENTVAPGIGGYNTSPSDNFDPYMYPDYPTYQPDYTSGGNT